MDVANPAQYGWPDRSQESPQPRPAHHHRGRGLVGGQRNGPHLSPLVITVAGVLLVANGMGRI
jgi:hypothetical protein